MHIFPEEVDQKLEARLECRDAHNELRQHLARLGYQGHEQTKAAEQVKVETPISPEATTTAAATNNETQAEVPTHHCQ